MYSESNDQRALMRREPNPANVWARDEPGLTLIQAGSREPSKYFERGCLMTNPSPLRAGDAHRMREIRSSCEVADSSSVPFGDNLFEIAFDAIDVLCDLTEGELHDPSLRLKQRLEKALALPEGQFETRDPFFAFATSVKNVENFDCSRLRVRLSERTKRCEP